MSEVLWRGFAVGSYVVGEKKIGEHGGENSGSSAWHFSRFEMNFEREMKILQVLIQPEVYNKHEGRSSIEWFLVHLCGCFSLV